MRAFSRLGAAPQLDEHQQGEVQGVVLPSTRFSCLYETDLVRQTILGLVLTGSVPQESYTARFRVELQAARKHQH